MQPSNDSAAVHHQNRLCGKGGPELQNLALGGREGWGGAGLDISQVLHNSEILSHEKPINAPTVSVLW